MIEDEGLCRRYGKALALNDFCLSAGPGQIVGLVGPNGSGKSTAIKVLATLIRPSAGKASICGADVIREPLKARLDLGYVSERVAVWDELNAYENLHCWGRMRGLPQKGLDSRIESLLKELALEGERKLVSKYSKGMRQRVAIGMALLHSPSVILLDEPTTGLDPDGRLLLRDIILRLAKEGKTVLLSTHDLSEAAKVCSRVLFLKKGETRGSGDPAKEDMEARYRELIS
jgi:ABC-2 type transport system ATP-binding protein